MVFAVSPRVRLPNIQSKEALVVEWQGFWWDLVSSLLC